MSLHVSAAEEVQSLEDQLAEATTELEETSAAAAELQQAAAELQQQHQVELSSRQVKCPHYQQAS